MIENYGVYLLMIGIPIAIFWGSVIFVMERSARHEREQEKSG